jgi:hypothetical protein
MGIRRRAGRGPCQAPSRLRATQADIAFPPTATRQRHRSSHGDGQVDRSKMFPAAAAQAKPPRSRVLQMFKCATCQIQQTPCSAAPIRMTYNGPGGLGEWNTSSELLEL